MTTPTPHYCTHPRGAPDEGCPRWPTCIAPDDSTPMPIVVTWHTTPESLIKALTETPDLSRLLAAHQAIDVASGRDLRPAWWRRFVRPRSTR